MPPEINPVGLPPARLATARLVLRPVEHPDVPAMVRLWTDPDVRRHLGGPVPEEEVRVRERHCAGAPGAFAVVREEDGAVLGGLLVEPGARDGRTELSYAFLPEHWGHGYASEAVAALVNWYLDAVRSQVPGVVVAVTQAANKRSVRLLESLGATLVEEFVEWGEPQVVYGWRTGASGTADGPVGQAG